MLTSHSDDFCCFHQSRNKFALPAVVILAKICRKLVSTKHFPKQCIRTRIRKKKTQKLHARFTDQIPGESFLETITLNGGGGGGGVDKKTSCNYLALQGCVVVHFLCNWIIM